MKFVYQHVRATGEISLNLRRNDFGTGPGEREFEHAEDARYTAGALPDDVPHPQIPRNSD